MQESDLISGRVGVCGLLDFNVCHCWGAFAHTVAKWWIGESDVSE